MKKSKFTQLIIGGLLVTSSIGVFSVANAIEYGGFGARPAYPIAGNPRTESIFVHTLDAGQVQNEGVRVVNNTTEKKTLLVYATDSTPSTDGSFACKQFVEPKTDVGAWIKLAKSEVTLEPSTNEVVPFTITVPKDASAGEHNGCILIQEKKTKADGQGGVSISVRTGLRVAITVSGELTRKLELLGFTVSKSKDGFLLHPLVKNTGNVSIDADAKVTTKYFFGLSYITQGGQYPVLRGDISDWNFEIKKPYWGGWYRSTFTVAYDQGQEAGVGIKSGQSLTVLEGPSVWFFSFPQFSAFVIEIVVLLCIIAVIVVGWLSIKRKRWITENWVAYNVKPGDDMNTIAKSSDVSWKLIVKVNKLKPPYILVPGENIKVPPRE